MTNTEQLYNRRKELVPNALGIFNATSAKSANGAIIIDVDDRELIDFAGGIGVVNAGHTPQEVVKAIQTQAEKFIHVSFNVAVYEEYLILAEKMIKILSHGEPTKLMLVNTGAEAVENAIKIARNVTGRQAIICFDGAFHGRSMGASTLTSNIKYKDGTGPFLPEVYRMMDFPYYSPKISKSMTEEEFTENFIKKLKKFFSQNISISSTAAIILELVQGEGGFTVASKPCIEYLREFCTENGIMLIFDEVQSGFGRTGKWAAFEHYGVYPDISTWAKSMGSGMPIGAVMGTTKVMDAIKPGVIGGTYGGNPVCCVSASATIDYMIANNINEAGEKVGEIVRNKMIEWQSTYPEKISDVRGLGAMLSIEFSNSDGSPDTEICKKIQQYCLENGLIVITAGTYSNCIRVLSPLIIDENILNKGLNILEKAIKDSI